MPKIKSTLKTKMSNWIWIAPYNENKEVFPSDGKVICCLACKKSVSAEKKYLLNDHRSKTIQHINALQRNKEKKQLLITSQNSSSINVIFEYLRNAFVTVNTPLHKLDNHVLKSFLDKHTGKLIPDESTLRKNYILNIYKSVMDQIISDNGNN
ncbi:Hypothetical protein CINCED_3A006098 [Cinara cedri]|uniref:Uncharacterized protein n=1 Tax=Cinara cedri TaxID=506608 RepID=A0A5E4MKH8_9HEMI|nr:Hypothetical protein CINCED_3A006098 [Cinara cedri]